jgi:predicted molibdopterin-dependent oxidoreductase YjgC
MLRRLEIGGKRGVVRFHFEEQTIEAREGDTIAAALLAAGVNHFRSAPVLGSPRAPYCMMGVCFECLVEVDGLANCQSCIVQVASGMRVRRQDGDAEVPHGE